MWKEKRDERDRWRKKEEEEGKGYRSCELYNLIKKKGVRKCKNFARRFEIMINLMNVLKEQNLSFMLSCGLKLYSTSSFSLIRIYVSTQKRTYLESQIFN